MGVLWKRGEPRKSPATCSHLRSRSVIAEEDCFLRSVPQPWYNRNRFFEVVSVGERRVVCDSRLLKSVSPSQIDQHLTGSLV